MIEHNKYEKPIICIFAIEVNRGFDVSMGFNTETEGYGSDTMLGIDEMSGTTDNEGW